MTSAASTPNFNPLSPPQLCIVFNSSQSADVQQYINSIETRLLQVKSDISKLGPTATRQADLSYLQDKYTKQD